MCFQFLIWRSLFVLAILVSGCLSASGQTLARNDGGGERKAPSALNVQTNGLRKLPFEQSIIIYYNAPGKPSEASTSKAPSSRDEQSKTRSDTSAVTSRPESRQLASQISNTVRGFEPIVIYYPGHPTAAVAKNSAASTVKNTNPSNNGVHRSSIDPAQLSFPNSELKQAASTEALANSNSINSVENKQLSITKAQVETIPAMVQESTSFTAVEKIAERTVAAPVLPATFNVQSPSSTLNESSASASVEPTTLALGNANAGEPIAMNNSAVELTNDAKYAEAESLLERAIAAEPTSARFHRNLSIVFERMNRLDEALSSARTAARLAPSEASVLDQLCVLELGHGSVASAVACYEKLQSVKPLDVLAQAYYGTALFRSGKVKESEPVLEKAAQSTPPLAEALNALGVMYFSTKRVDEAIAAFKNGVEANPEMCDVRYNLAVAYLSIHNKAGALSQYNILKSSNSKLADQLYRALFSDKLIFVDEMKSKNR